MVEDGGSLVLWKVLAAVVSVGGCYLSAIVPPDSSWDRCLTPLHAGRHLPFREENPCSVFCNK